MPGLYLGGMGGAGVSAGNGMSNPRNSSTATQAAFGVGSGGNASTAAAIAPNDPFGVALWTAIVAAGLLVWIRHSLPA
jgi:hypothetical protein